MKSLLLVLLLYGSFANLFAAEYVVVSNTFSKLSFGEIRALYLKKTSFHGSEKVIPLNLGSRNAIRVSFEKNVLHMGFSRLVSYWNKQHYLGRRPPVTLKSQKSVKLFIKKVDGAIGYMDAKEVDNGMNILYRWSK